MLTGAHGLEGFSLGQHPSGTDSFTKCPCGKCGVLVSKSISDTVWVKSISIKHPRPFNMLLYLHIKPSGTFLKLPRLHF